MSARISPISLLLVFFTALAMNASAATYYIAANGSDTNSGTSNSAPWAHAPGMPSCKSVCASANPQPGDKFIFRGGDTWHFGDTSQTTYIGSGGWSWNWSGTSANPVYIGVDENWYSGSSWARPVLSGDNALWSGSGFVSSCAYDYKNAGNGLVSISANYWQFDNFEMTGVCWSSQISDNGMWNLPGSDKGFIFSNNYCHGWTMTSSASDNFPCVISFGSGSVNNMGQFASDVFDGSDSPHFPSGSSNCQWFKNDSAGCASGQGINGSAYDVHGSIFRYLSNMMVTMNCHTIHDNLFEYLYDSFASGSIQQHPNVMNCLGGGSGDNLYWYNNVMRHTYATEDVYLAVRTNVYFFNNVMFDNMNSVVGPVPGGCIRFNAVGNSASSQTAYIYNNTFGDATCQLKFELANSPLTPWNGTGNFQNNHAIGFSPAALNSVYVCHTSGTCAINDAGSEIFQTTSVANSQGYVASNNYAPTQTSGATVGVGAVLTSSCSVFSADGEFCGGTSDGAALQNANGGQVANFPAVAMISRPPTWDVGAHQFGTSARPVPPTNLTAVVH